VVASLNVCASCLCLICKPEPRPLNIHVYHDCPAPTREYLVWSTNQDRFSQMPPFGHSCSLPSCKANNRLHVRPTDCLFYRWSGAMLISCHLILKSSACKSCGCFIDSIFDWHIGFCLEVCLIHPQPSQVSGYLSVLISCYCSTWSNLMLINCLVVSLVDTRRAWNLSKNLVPSFL
jgi:hypothetical protein